MKHFLLFTIAAFLGLESLAQDCVPPVNLEIFNLTTDSVEFSWTDDVNDVVAFYQYTIVEVDTLPLAGPTTPEFEGAAYEDLLPGTTYNLYLRTFCTTGFGEWGEPLTFTTPCEITASLPYSLDFEEVEVPLIPECTTLLNAGHGNNWEVVLNPGSGFENNTLQYMGADSAADAWFFTQGLEMEADVYYYASFIVGNNSDTTTESLTVKFGQTADPSMNSGFMWANGFIGGGNADTAFLGPLTVPETGTYYFGFNSTSNAGEGNLYVDDILIEEYICGLPANVIVSDITDSTATASWEAPDGHDAEEYEFYFSTSNSAPTEATETDEISMEMTGLLPDTTYYVFVRSSCMGVWSGWSEVSFTTLCNITAPTGDAEQYFDSGATIADLLVTGDTVSWYATETGGEPLTPETLLENGATYYASQTSGCESNNRFEVTVQITTSIEDIIFAELEVFPNPALEILRISNSFNLKKVEIHNLLGQRILILTPLKPSVEIGLENIQPGVYLISVYAENAVKTLRLIKE